MVNGERVYSIRHNGTWYTPVDLDMVRVLETNTIPSDDTFSISESIEVFKQQDGGAFKI